MQLRREIDLVQLMANHRLGAAAFIERFTTPPPGTDTYVMATVFTDEIQSTAAVIAPRTNRSKIPKGRWVSEETKADFLLRRSTRGKPRDG